MCTVKLFRTYRSKTQCIHPQPPKAKHPRTFDIPQTRWHNWRPRSELFEVILVIRHGGRLDAGYVDASWTRTPYTVGCNVNEDRERSRNAQTPGVPTPLPRRGSHRKPHPVAATSVHAGASPSILPCRRPPLALAGQPQDRTITPTGNSFPRGQLDCRPYPRRARFSLAGQKEERRLSVGRESGVFRLGSVAETKRRDTRERGCDTSPDPWWWSTGKGDRASSRVREERIDERNETEYGEAGRGIQGLRWLMVVEHWGNWTIEARSEILNVAWNYSGPCEVVRGFVRGIVWMLGWFRGRVGYR